MAINTTTDSRPDRPRSIVHLPSHRSEFFSSRQSPLLPPPTRKNDLPYSSQSGPSERHSSPVKDPVQSESEVNKPVAGPSKSRSRSPVPISEPVAMQSSTGWSDDEDDFDGIEDAVATQSIPVMKAERGLGKGRGAVTLDDLFDDETEEDMYKDQAATSSRSGIRASSHLVLTRSLLMLHRILRRDSYASRRSSGPISIAFTRIHVTLPWPRKLARTIRTRKPLSFRYSSFSIT